MNIGDFEHFLSGIVWTCVLTLGSFSIGALLGVPLLVARLSGNFLIRILAQVFIQFVRAIPPIVWLFTIYFGIGASLLHIPPLMAALTGLGLIATANLAEIYRGALNALHSGQWEACQALNLSRWDTVKDVIGPQVLRVTVPSAASYLIGLLKDSAIASTIGATELTFQAKQLAQLSFNGLIVFPVAGLCYIALSLPIAWLSRKTDAHLRKRVAR